MAALEIRIYGDPILRQKAAAIDPIPEDMEELVEDMFETMQAANGIGLAAPQIGEAISLCVVDVGLIEDGREPEAFINPEILEEYGDDAAMEEGCLSIPGLAEDVTRKEAIRLAYQSLDGKRHELECDGLLARVLQHEIDHLHGILFVDRLGSFKRRLMNKKLRQLFLKK